MNNTKRLTPQELAHELDIDEDKFMQLLIGIGFAEIGNEADRQALISGHRVPSHEHFKIAINSYLNELD